MPLVYISPTVDPESVDDGQGGISRIVRAQHATLPQHGWTITDDPASADVLHCHVEIPPAFLRLYPEKPFVVTCHGAYWSDGNYSWDNWVHAVNQKVLAAIRSADVVVGVSQWVAQSLRRNTMRDVRVIYHGVDTQEWLPSERHGNYALWNKSRADPICDPAPMNAAAALLPHVKFVSTFGDAASNVELVGRMPYNEMRDLVRHAGAYLATSRETFGLGTLEAMAAGVPVVGYAFGGQVEIIEHGVDGWLVRPGDADGLAEGIEWALAHRDEIAPRARAKAEQFSVERTGEQYAQLYGEVLERKRREAASPRVSVIVPAYRMGDYLDDALRSVGAQSSDDWECIVVNDASPDPRDHEIAARYVAADERYREIVLPQNGYLANARNVGIEAARGRYIMPLDADDQLTPGTLDVLAGALDADPALHIAYGNVYFVQPDGRTPVVYREGQARGLAPGHSGWPVRFNLEWMLRGPGQLMPYASMFRRSVWEQTGGYRTRCRSSEDQDFWLRATSYGFTAQMVTQAETLIYRVRKDSMSSAGGVGWEEHRGWYPWCADRSLVPAGAIQDGKPVDQLPMPAHDPVPIAVVIPVGPGHARYLHDAVDSVDAQTFREWECIVVNDTGEALPRLPSWVRVIERPCTKCSGAGRWASGGEADFVEFDECPRCEGTGLSRFGGAAAARNAGIAASRAPLFLPLDADDYLQPRALELMLANALEGTEPAVVFSDFYEDPHEAGSFTVYQCPDYDPRALMTHGALHAVTALTPRRFWEEVGGYDETLPWEDWAFAIAVAAAGHCSRRIALPLFTYRKHTGMRRNENVEDFEESKRLMMQKDFGLQRGGELLACSRCGAGRQTTSFGTMAPLANGVRRTPPEDAVLLRYTGPRAGTFRFKSKVNPAVAYAFSVTDNERYVHKEDAKGLLERPDFELVAAEEIARAAEVLDTPPLVAAREPVLAGAQDAASGVPSWAAGAAYGMEEAPAAPVAAPRASVAAEAPPEPSVIPERTAQPPNQQAVALAEKHSREELNRMAQEAGLADVETMRTKLDVAIAILVKRSLGI